MDVVAGGIRFPVRGGWPLVVSGVWGWSARVLPSHVLVLLVPGGLWPSGIGWWAVVTCSRGGPGQGTLRWTRASKQAGKALRSQGHHHARVM